ncbi:MAG: glycosyltransferase family 8 protein [Acidimicrobiia bacterium]|nr:glycosyltransferase family 8 protein [Acidimicrobiia bacterium]
MSSGLASRTDPVVVALAFDSSYVAPASTLIRSCLRRHDGPELRFEVIHDDDVPDDHLRRLEGMCLEHGASIRIHRIDPRLVGGLPLIDRFGPVVWSRLFLPEILSDVTRVLYLDCDVLVLNRLDPLWEVELGPSVMAAAANVVEPAAREHVARIGVHYPGGLFNSGVMLFQLDRMRCEGSTNQLVGFALDYGEKLLWPDQDALNVVFNGRWHPLHPRWNAQNSLWSWHDWAIDVFGRAQVEEAVRDPAIRHFEGPSVAKPWHYLCPVPHRDLYLQTLAETPWANEPLQDRTMSTRLIARLPRRSRLDAYRRLLRARSTLEARFRVARRG